MRLTLKQKLIASFILVSALTLAFSSFLFYRAWLDYAVKSKKAELLKQGRTLAVTLASPRNGAEESRLVEPIIRYSAQITGARIIVNDSSGRVLADFGRINLLAPEQLPQPGAANRLGQRPGQLLRPRPNQPLGATQNKVTPNEGGNPPQLNSEVAYASVPINGASGGRVLLVAAVRDIKRAQGPAFTILLTSGIISFIIASLAGLYLAFTLLRPLDRLKKAVRDMGQGKLLQQVPVETGDEVGELLLAFNVMSRKVDAAYALQRDFASNASHELKTPLTSIEGFSKVLLEGQVADEEQQRKYLKIINTESRRVAKIVNDLLAIARIDAGTFKVTPSEIDTEAMLANICDKFTPLAENKSITLSMKPERLSFVSDGAIIEQIIGNLVENAIKYTGEGGSIDVAAEGAGAHVCFRIKDTGRGIAPADQRKIFNRFYRTADPSPGVNPNGAGGTGLGLAICSELTKVLGGKIEVLSASGAGSEFSVYVPKKQ
ncbi:MAG: sensor histidine kinase [Candidatus Aquicultor sp.]